MLKVLFWAAGNLVLPLVPIIAAAAAQRLATRTVSLRALLEDGVLFFYSATVAAVFLLDAFRRGGAAGDARAAVAGIGETVSAFLLVFSTMGFSFAALGRAGVRDLQGQPLDLAWLTGVSWIFALSRGHLKRYGAPAAGYVLMTVARESTMSASTSATGRLPFSAPGAVNALQYGVYGVTVGAGAAGLAAAAAAPLGLTAAVPVFAGLGLAAWGYKLGKARGARVAPSGG